MQKANENSVEEQEQEIEKLLPSECVITALNGEDFKVPICSWKREIKIIQAISRILKKFPPEIFQIELGKKDKKEPGVAIQKFIGQLPKLLTSISDEGVLEDLTEVAAQVMNTEKAWIEDNLASPQIIELIVPFLLKRLTQLSEKLPQVTGSMLVTPEST